ncbi:MAG: hypothetical protein J1E63_04120, partial [Muribaculaceae bacterium]|nr:hypothetical protein [Muribaculaceae bacterium]
MYNIPENYTGNPQSVDMAASSVMKRVYFKMTLGLLVTAFVSLFCSSSMGFLNLMAQHNWMMWVFFGIELLIVIGISGA